MSAFTQSQSQRQFNWNRYRTPFILCGSVTISFFLLAFVIAARRQTDPSFAPLDKLSLTILAIVLTGSLIGVKYVIENVAVDRSLQHSTTSILTLTHLLAALTLALTAPSIIVGAFPIMIAMTAECMKRSFANNLFASSLPQNVIELPANEASRQNGADSLLQFDDRDSELEFNEEIDEVFASDCTQRISRFRVDSGEAVSGQLRAEFNASERTKAIHVAFCPPFAEKPTAEVFQIGGPAADINQTLIEKFGMRLEIKLAGSPDVNARDHEHGVSVPEDVPEDVIIEFLVESKRACA